MDAPAALLPDGNVLIEASPVDVNCGWIDGAEFFEFDGTNLNQVAGTKYSSSSTAYIGRLLALPNGQILFLDGSGDAELYTETGIPVAAAAPSITSSPAAVGLGATNMLLTGTQLNGVSGAVAYGDDYQAATNYPLVRITDSTGKVHYAKTHGFSTMGVATGATLESTYFDVPAGLATGEGNLVVVANGIPSQSNPIDILPVSTTTLITSGSPSAVGAQVTFTATVSGAGGTPTGTVAFHDGTNSTATVLASSQVLNGSGVATFATSTLSVGIHTITATYSGDAIVGSSSSTAVLQVVGQASTTSMTALPNPYVIGSGDLTLIATVTSTSGSGPTPTGTVTFMDANPSSDGNTIVGSVALSDGTTGAFQSFFPSDAYIHQITAVYSGDSNYSSSTSIVVPLQVNNAVPTVSSLYISSVPAGSAAFDEYVFGANFGYGAVMKFSGVTLSTVYSSCGEFGALIPATDLTTAGTFPITMFNPAPGGGTSAPLTFTVTNPAPTLTNIAPNSGAVNAAIASFVLTGTGFVASSTVNFGSNVISGGTVGAGGTTLTVVVPAGDVTPVGPIAVTATNPQVNALGGGTSASQTFTVTGTGTTLTVETKPDGSGTVVPAQNIVSGAWVTGYAISRDASGNFVANVAAAWTLANVTGGVANTDLVAAANNLSATFTGHWWARRRCTQ